VCVCVCACVFVHVCVRVCLCLRGAGIAGICIVEWPELVPADGAALLACEHLSVHIDVCERSDATAQGFAAADDSARPREVLLRGIGSRYAAVAAAVAAAARAARQ
jgi:hypothetical protein